MLIDHCRVSPFQANVLRAVWQGKGLPVPTQVIFNEMYRDDPDGGPSDVSMYSSLKAALHLLRLKLIGSGVSIESAGYGGGYRLVVHQQAAK